MKNKQGFTLAEVLITLVIIGVIAALTIPTLIKANKRTETEAGIKKMYAMISNALKLSAVDNGDFNSWDLSPNTGAEDRLVTPYIKFTQKCSPSNPCKRSVWYHTNGTVWGADMGSTNNTSYGGYLSDGSFVEVWVGGNTYCDSYGCILYTFDLNGQKGPNTVGKDVFWLGAYKPGIISSICLPPSNNVLSTAINLCKTATNAHGALYCSAWIMANGWKIPDDYPWL